MTDTVREIDIVREVESIHREVGNSRIAAGDAHVVRMRRTYDAPIDDVWDALTNPERIGRWFLPISGDYRVGGRYQFEGNAGGEILACERPNRLHATWVMGETDGPPASEVEVLLAAVGDEATTLELVHTAVVPDEMWSEYGPGAVGVGWDGGLLGLSLHLLGREAAIEDRAAWPMSDEGRQFYRLSSSAWGVANVAAGADPAAVKRNVASTTGFYTGEPVAES